jgi:hypothetical protein
MEEKNTIFKSHCSDHYHIWFIIKTCWDAADREIFSINGRYDGIEPLCGQAVSSIFQERILPGLMAREKKKCCIGY